MEEIEDEDAYPRNVAPLNKSSVLELSDGSDDEHNDNKCPPSVTADEDGDGDDEEVFEEPEESAEAELGQLLPHHI